MATKKLKKQKKAAKAKRDSRKNASTRKQPTRGGGRSPGAKARIHQGVALEKAGQSGDDQALPTVEDVESESVAELADEGQGYEASVVSGVEAAADEEEHEVTTEEVNEDDVPLEYRNPREGE